MPAQSRLYLIILAISLCAPVPPAQTAAGITNHALPVSGFLSAIDVTGNVFFAGKTGPVTAGAPQTAVAAVPVSSMSSPLGRFRSLAPTRTLARWIPRAT